jgi:hypothetical protein
MKLGVVGSRSILNRDAVTAAIMDCPWLPTGVKPMDMDLTLVSGGADGVDTSAELWAEENGFLIDVIEPNYDDWSGEHPAKQRNTGIVEASDAVVAVWDGHSNGTRDTIDKALDRSVPLYVEIVD